MNAELVGGGPHDGARISVPADCIAVVIVTQKPDGEYLASLATRGVVVGDRLEDCLIQFVVERAQHGRW